MAQTLQAPQGARSWLCKLVPVLTLAITGGALLPVAASFAETGIVAGTVLFVLIAVANVYSNELLLWQSYATGHTEMEEVSGAIGGRAWRVLTEGGLLVLIWGTAVPAFAQFGETLSASIRFLSPSAGGPFLADDGRLVIILAATAMVPVTLVHNMSKLTGIATASFLLVSLLILTVIWRSVAAGFPAIHTGAYPFWGFSSIRRTAFTMSDFAFMTFTQPIILPMMEDLPAGKDGVTIMSWAVRISVLGTSAAMYWGTGMFGAALLGQEAVATANILQNDLGGGWWQGVLNIAFAVFILVAIAPYELAARKALDALLPELPAGHLQQWRGYLETLIFFAGTAGVAAIWPSQSFQLTVFTGGSSVMLVCFVIPVVNHYILYFSRGDGDAAPAGQPSGFRRMANAHDDGALLLSLLSTVPEAHSSCSQAYPSYHSSSSWQKLYWMFVPVLVLLVGVSSSAVTLWTVT